ncbi:hypothetical protein KP509_04G019300 [Ceratopteris richardii]|uniref:CBM20 domain-containing protein n=1 Tax=Ceratopteris richardii TaxID=49495 RepID=A0A8T2UV19_CERRI|nr:hypothetical protein KP509_04G019300 [Ceratopteris richardii]
MSCSRYIELPLGVSNVSLAGDLRRVLAAGLSIKASRYSSYAGLRPIHGRLDRRRLHKTVGKFMISPRCEATKVKLKLRLDHQVQFGEHHALMGSAQSMGSWQQRIPMNWTDSGWVADLEIDSGERVEFKYLIVLQDGNVIWEDGSNRVLDLTESESLELVCRWNDTKSHDVLEVSEVSRRVEESFTNGSLGEVEEQEALASDSEDDADSEFIASTEFVQEWQGREVTFMRSNEHKGDGIGKWDTSGLDGSAFDLVDGDKHARNWWRKLEVVQKLVTNTEGGLNRLGTLINVSIYLKWINTGQIQCFEDGGHHRPNKHAGIARYIFRELERMISDKNLLPQERVVIRKIHPCLPSFKSEFTASVPLTRIRDIAHRNDIPHNLKQEIKHTIQNKLHRNAGPEDLVATELLLGRVTKKDGEYSAAFVEQLKIFYIELKDFFNAGSLTEQLDSIRPSLDELAISILDDFLTKKKRLDDVLGAPSDGDTNELIATMHALTGLRAALLKGLESGLRNDASDTSIAMRQKWRLCEIGLEDYMFVLLSRFCNVIDSMGGSEMLVNQAKSRSVNDWNHPLGAVVLGIRHLGLSGWQQGECMAIENEVMAWQSAGIIEKQDGMKVWALRLKATIERARRLAESYSDTLLQIYPTNVEKLGSAFGIPDNTIRTFTEAEIRSSVVFQLSKLCSLLLKAARAVADEHGWDPLVPGTAVGTLVEVDRILPGSLPSSGSIILLVREADGDEEVKASGENVAGVILLQELPHLSHLGVRARQEKVVFVTCEDDDEISSLQKLIGKTVKLEATAASVLVSPYTEDVSADHKAPESFSTSASPVQPIKFVLSDPVSTLDLVDAKLETSGAKAVSCGRLAQLSEETKNVYNDRGIPAAFHVPKGMVIPFGAMEAALRTSGNEAMFKELLTKVETASIESGELEGICKQLQELVSEQKPPSSIIEKIASTMPVNARLIVRSSANVEDLAGMSGAGLYESIPNVRASESDSFGRSVAKVWASLYTRRAVLSRRMAGVSQKNATMAVLVQELLSPDLSFVLHTVSPIDKNEKLVVAEIASGLGETLASGTRGSPWRVAGNKFDGSVKVFAFANFSEELVVQTDGEADGTVRKQIVDYSRKSLSTNGHYRDRLTEQLTTIGFLLEQKFGGPQDVEGCIIGQKIYIVQTRPQPL